MWWQTQRCELFYASWAALCKQWENVAVRIICNYIWVTKVLNFVSNCGILMFFQNLHLLWFLFISLITSHWKFGFYHTRLHLWGRTTRGEIKTIHPDGDWAWSCKEINAHRFGIESILTVAVNGKTRVSVHHRTRCADKLKMKQSKYKALQRDGCTNHHVLYVCKSVKLKLNNNSQTVLNYFNYAIHCCQM